MHLTIANSKIKKRNLVLINNDTHQRETLSERPIRPPLSDGQGFVNFFCDIKTLSSFIWLGESTLHVKPHAQAWYIKKYHIGELYGK